MSGHLVRGRHDYALHGHKCVRLLKNYRNKMLQSPLVISYNMWIDGVDTAPCAQRCQTQLHPLPACAPTETQTAGVYFMGRSLRSPATTVMVIDFAAPLVPRSTRAVSGCPTLLPSTMACASAAVATG